MSLVALSVACGGAGGAHDAGRMYGEAQKLVDAGQLDGAVALLEQLVESHPDGELAAKAREEIVLYRGLARAEASYPIERARETVVLAARAVERFHRERGRWPQSLGQLVPELLPGDPLDPWERLLVYEPKARGAGYRLSCFGADGAVGGRGADADLYVEDGEFVADPPPGAF